MSILQCFNESYFSKGDNQMTNENTHVYCINCLHFRLCDEGIPYCPFEDECDIHDCEDSRPFKDRPNYLAHEK